MPRTSRITGQGESLYHVTSRVVEKAFKFDAYENKRNVALMRRVETFSAVEIVSFCFMSDHFHLLVRIPVPNEDSDEILLDRIEALYGPLERNEIAERWNLFRETKNFVALDKERNAYRRRMYNLGEFMKTLKQRLTMSFNSRHDRSGTLWESRYYSILLEDTEKVLSAVSAYIDLNPVRAKMVDKAQDYTFSSYGEACKGKEKARTGLCRIYQKNNKRPSWNTIHKTYRQRMAYTLAPSESVSTLRAEDIHPILTTDKEKRLPEILGSKCRFFSKGIALGSLPFVRSIRKAIASKTPRTT